MKEINIIGLILLNRGWEDKVMEIFGRKVVLVEDDTSFCDKRCAFFTSGICEASIQWCACEDANHNTNRHFESVKDANDTQNSPLPF